MPARCGLVVEEDYGAGALAALLELPAVRYPDRTGDLRSVVKIADFYSARQWHSTGMY